MHIRRINPRLDLRRGSKPRSAGVHLSGILRHIALIQGYLKKGKEDEPDLDELILRVAADPKLLDIPAVFWRIVMGLAWEDKVFQLNPTWDCHPFELHADGIFGTPDAISWDMTDPITGLVLPGDCILHELKFTHKSASTDIEKQWMWWGQVKSYMEMMRLQYGLDCRVARLHAMHINGDYHGFQPDGITWEAVVEPKEAAAMWRLMKRYRDEVKPELGQAGRE